MKTNNRRLAFMSLFLATALSIGLIQKVHAQDLLDETDDLLQDGSAIEMDDMDINGKLSPSEQLRKRREKLEERNKVMVEKKIEDIRVKQEIALTNKLQDAFGKSLNNLNEDKKEEVVHVQQAAPIAPQPVVVAPVVETKVIAPEVEKVERNSKVIPSLGGQGIKGTGIDFESKLSLAVDLETKLQSNVSMGIELGYTTLSAIDGSNTYTNGGMYNGGYYNTFNNGRTMSYSKVNVGTYGKFFFIEEARIKPFLGAGLDFNRTNIKYDDQGNGYYNNGISYGDEGFSSNYLSAKVRLGVEADFNETIGANIDLSYAKSLTSGMSTNSNASTINPDQTRLQNVTKMMEQSDVTAFQAGLVIKF